MKTLNKVRYILLIFSVIVIIGYLVNADYNNFWSFDNILRLIAPILLALGMIFGIRHTNQQKNKQK